MAFLAALPLKDRYWRTIRKEIQRVFDDVLYRPLYEALKNSQLEFKNASHGALYDAIAEGTVWYFDGRFWGSFNAAISKQLREMGATFNSKSKTWSYTGPLPAELSMAAAAATVRYDTLRRTLFTTLDQMQIASINAVSGAGKSYQQTIQWMEGDFEKALKGVTIIPKLTEAAQNVIAAEWGENLDLYIKKWMDEEIIKLRKMVQAEAFSGRRAENLAKEIEHSYQVSTRKAEFLARQETSLLMSSYHRQRFKEAGVGKFKWVTAQDERVREEHRHLNNKIFSWDVPPVDSNGNKIYPGTPFNCRCVAVPVLD